MKKFLIIISILCIGASSLFAQSVQVSGTVTGADDGQSMPGVSVVVKGTTLGTVTDVNGKYSIGAPQGATLIFSFVGMATQEIAIENRQIINVVMETSTQAIDEVIVVAYGTAKKSSFTGSVASVKAETLEKRQVSDGSKALQGTMSGVQVVSTSGQPGTAATIRIRGIGSISASSNPLYVVDGIPVESSLSSINAADIESITTLKDAAANSLYGARGSNGVVLITTKRGTSGNPRVIVETRFGFNTRAVPAYDVVTDKGQYMELLWESLRNQGIATGEQNPAAYASDNLLAVTQGFNPFTNVPKNQVVGLDGKLNPSAVAAWDDDWMKDPFHKGFRNEDMISISGGSSKNTYYISIGYLTEDSYITASDFQRYTARVKVDQEVTSWLKAGLNISYAKVKMNNPWSINSDNSYSNIFFFAQQNPPIYPIYKYDKTTGQLILDKNGNKQYEFSTPFSPGTNPLSALENDVRDSDYDYGNALGFAEISFLKDFKLRFNIAAETYNGFNNRYQTPIGGDALNVGGRNTRAADKLFALTAQQLLTYKKGFNGHNIDVLMGHETTMQKNNVLSAEKENFLIPENPELVNAARMVNATSYSQEYTLESFLSRAQYDYLEKYFLSGSFRYDGSSRFSPDSRWGAFWSIGGAWLLSKENFLSSVSQINELKVKASYGTQGNDHVLDVYGYSLYNVYQDQYAVSTSGGGNIAVAYVLRGNPNLKWESSKNFNVGAEFRFFDRLFGGVEYYEKNTHNMLYQKPLAPSKGVPSWIYDNAITMKNSGVELELGVEIFRTNELFWEVRGNLTTQKNKITKLPADTDLTGNGYVSGDYWYKVGGSVYDFYTYTSAGVDPATGKALWYAEERDADDKVIGDMVVTDYGAASRYQIGKSALPDVYGGLSTTVEWMGVDFSVQAAYQFGGYGWDEQYAGLMTSMQDATSGIHKDVQKRRWTTPGQVTDVPRLQYGLSNQVSLSDRFLVSKSYFSINNITLGYTLPKRLTDKVSIEKLRVYVNCDNVVLFSARKGYDPRIFISGAGTYAYGAMRTLSMGLNVNF